MRSARFKVEGNLDSCVPTVGTMTVDRARGLVAVRPYRRRREYVLPLGVVASMICMRVIKAELAEQRRAKKATKVKRGMGVR